MSIQPRPTSSAREKEVLEVRKLRTEILFVKLSFAAQILNTAALLTLGVLVLFYFQRPQVEQMEAARLTGERQQVGSALERAVTIENPQQRAIVFTMLKALWPQYAAISLAEEARNLMDIKTGPVGANEMCGQALSNIAQLEQGRDRLLAQLGAESKGSLLSGLAGVGPIAAALRAQIAALLQKIETAKAQAAQCRLR